MIENFHHRTQSQSRACGIFTQRSGTQDNHLGRCHSSHTSQQNPFPLPRITQILASYHNRRTPRNLAHHLDHGIKPISIFQYIKTHGSHFFLHHLHDRLFPQFKKLYRGQNHLTIAHHLHVFLHHRCGFQNNISGIHLLARVQHLGSRIRVFPVMVMCRLSGSSLYHYRVPHIHHDGHRFRG